jgi:GDP-D-mannose dehydratase
MWLMLQQSSPDDYVIATGRTAKVEEMSKIAFNYVGFDDFNKSNTTFCQDFLKKSPKIFIRTF